MKVRFFTNSVSLRYLQSSRGTIALGGRTIERLGVGQVRVLKVNADRADVISKLFNIDLAVCEIISGGEARILHVGAVLGYRLTTLCREHAAHTEA